MGNRLAGAYVKGRCSGTVLRIFSITKIKKYKIINYKAIWVSGGNPKEWYPNVVDCDEQVIDELYEDVLGPQNVAYKYY